MTYPVTCDCGKTHQVAGSAAGTTLACDCQRAVEVPSLARLKASAGESSVSADFELEQLLQTGRLPLERECVMCGRLTQHQVPTTVVCERKRVIKAAPQWYELVFFAMVGWFLALMAYLRRTRTLRTIGEDRFFPLPIRACEACAVDLQSANAARAALLRTPLYAALLDKYPRAEVRLGLL